MKVFSVPALLAAALLSAIVGLPFLPLAQTGAGPFFLEVRLTSTRSGVAQLYFDTGTGFSEPASSRAQVSPSSTPQPYRFGFPAGTYRSFRFDPLDGSARMTLADARIVSRGGRLLRKIAASEFKPANQIAAIQVSGDEARITLAPEADDPELLLTLPTALVAKRTLSDLLLEIPLPSLILFLALAVVLFSLDRLPRIRTAAGTLALAARRHPRRAIAVTAALAVILSAYPVVFLGKSFVSPNLGTLLLYDGYPTLPGYRAREVTDVQLSDVGAIMWQHVPFSTIQHRALAHGELPLWNRYNSLGTPLLGQGQSMFGDPLHFLVIAANGAAWAWDLKYLLAKWAFATGLGLLALAVLRGREPARRLQTAGGRSARESGAGPVADAPAVEFVPALIVAAAAPFIGFFLYRLNHPAYFSLCYAPWSLYGWVCLARAPRLRQVALRAAGLIAANLALMASGTAKEAYMLLLTMNLAGAAVMIAADLPWRARLMRLGAAAWAGVIFALLTMPLWATFFHTLKQAYTSYNAASAFQLQPAMLLGLFDELLFRPLMPNHRLLDPSLNVLLLLGGLYFLATLRATFLNRTAMAIAASSLVPLALAFGLIPPRWIVHWPILAHVAHLDNTFSCALIVLWTVLAAVGFAQAGRRLGTREGRGDLVIVGLLLFALGFNWIAFGQAVHRPVLGPTTFTVNKPGESLAVTPFIWGDLGALLLASVGLLTVVRRSLARRTLSSASALVMLACVLVLLWRHALHGPGVGFHGYIQQPTERVDFHARSDAITFLRQAVRQEPARALGLHGNFFPGWTAVYGLETVHGPDAIMSPRLREWIDASGIERWWDWRLYVDPEKIGAARPLLDALNVRWYLDGGGDQRVLNRSLKLAQVGDLEVYESLTAWPRAYFTDRVLRYRTVPELLTALRASEGKPLAAVEAGDAIAVAAVAGIPADLATRTTTAARQYQLTENTTSFTVHATGPGLVVLTETWWPGDFRVEVNGRREPVIRVNHAVKGVTVPGAGEYRVTFRYWPHGFFRSLVACGLGVVLLALSLWLALRPRPSR